MGHPIDNKNVACCETQQHNTAKRIRFAELGLTDLASGVYTFNCFVGNVKYSTGKLIKY
jgi:hypothetical protein